MKENDVLLISIEEFFNSVKNLMIIFKDEKLKSDKELSNFNKFYDFFIKEKVKIVSELKKIEQSIISDKPYLKKLQIIIENVNKLFIEMKKLEIKNIPLQKEDIEKEFRLMLPENKSFFSLVKESDDIKDLYYNLAFLLCYLDKYKEIILRERKVKTVDYLDNNYPFLYNTLLNKLLESENKALSLKFKELFFDNSYLKEKKNVFLLEEKYLDFINYYQIFFEIVKASNEK